MKCCLDREAVEYTLSILGGKWKWIILVMLFAYKVQRYGELKKNIPSITHKMLSQQLKELETQGLVCRKEYPQIPPKVEYSITRKGKTIVPILKSMSDWGTRHPGV